MRQYATMFWNVFFEGAILMCTCVLMMMMNCFCGMVDRRKVISLISSRDHCQRYSPSRISDTPRAGFQPAQDLSSGLVEWSCAVFITTAPWHHFIWESNFDMRLCFEMHYWGSNSEEHLCFEMHFLREQLFWSSWLLISAAAPLCFHSFWLVCLLL